MTELTNSELQSVITEMTARVTKVAELVDHVLPDSGVGAGVKDCAAKLQQHVYTLAARAAGVEILDEIEKVSDITEKLKILAVNDCIATFKLLESIRAGNTDHPTELSIKGLDILSTHARELFSHLK